MTTLAELQIFLPLSVGGAMLSFLTGGNVEKISNLDQLAEVLGDGGPYAPDEEFDTVEELVDALVELGNTDKVFVHHDEHLGMKSLLSDEFLSKEISEVDPEYFENDIAEVLSQAQTILELSERQLTEDDLEEIREDKLSRGDNDDD